MIRIRPTPDGYLLPYKVGDLVENCLGQRGHVTKISGKKRKLVQVRYIGTRRQYGLGNERSFKRVPISGGE